MTPTTVITGNDLLSGEVVYLTESGQWSPNHLDAMVLVSTHKGTARLTEMQNSDKSVVGPYLAEVVQASDGTVLPNHFREIFRIKGPSNRLLGKQAA